MTILRKILVAAAALLAAVSVNAREYEVFGPMGGINMKVALPEGFDTRSDSCPMVILMHGIFSSEAYNPMPQIAKELAKVGIASIRFDFNGHGRSEGRIQDMTVEKEIADAMAIWTYVKGLPYVSSIGLLGHSQGGVIASMTAGRLADAGESPAGLVLLAPGSVIQEACQGGKFFSARFDPQDPPEYIKIWGGLYKLGREYILETQKLDIFGTAAHYKGPVRLIHGTKDKIVPMWCSEKYQETYGTDAAELFKVEGGDHTIARKRREVVALTVAFFQRIFF